VVKIGGIGEIGMWLGQGRGKRRNRETGQVKGFSAERRSGFG